MSEPSLHRILHPRGLNFSHWSIVCSDDERRFTASHLKRTVNPTSVLVKRALTLEGGDDVSSSNHRLEMRRHPSLRNRNVCCVANSVNVLLPRDPRSTLVRRYPAILVPYPRLYD